MTVAVTVFAVSSEVEISAIESVGTPSSSVIVTVAVDDAIIALAGFESVTVNVSSSSSESSPPISIAICF